MRVKLRVEKGMAERAGSRWRRIEETEDN